ncbi:Leucine-rich repeat-containing protein [Artemisia annua]|uniref:Leucine-rich repeat-containing protein n=1 Tax=Artemisia annua TaxID=35608 RepID=A0A2U1LCR5_ARTAN|nr:Leucine-rich repeat-containing protein [Artemisia annua]
MTVEYGGLGNPMLQMLVYEFISQGTLRDWLNGMKLLRLDSLNFTAKSRESLSIQTRLNIALDSAKGILYLHTEANPHIFHRNIKTSNILIDSKLTVKVADFGHSMLAPLLDDYGVGPNYVSTVVRGTPVLFTVEKVANRMALDSAKGILYLHTEANPHIFHRNIKTSNILIDSKLTVKVADFGHSMLAPLLDDYGVGPNYVSTVVRGTPGKKRQIYTAVISWDSVMQVLFMVEKVANRMANRGSNASNWNNHVGEMSNIQGHNSIWNVIRKICFAATVYHLWQERNQREFVQEERDGDTLIQRIREEDSVTQVLFTGEKVAIRMGKTRKESRMHNKKLLRMPFLAWLMNM